MKRLKRKNIRRISAFFLLLILLLMTGCKNSSVEKIENNKQSSLELIQNSEYGYKAEYIDIQKKPEEINEPVLAGDTLYFTNVVGEKDGYGSWRLQSIDLSAPQEIKTYDSFSKGRDFIQNLRFLHPNEDGGITFLQILYSVIQEEKSVADDDALEDAPVTEEYLAQSGINLADLGLEFSDINELTIKEFTRLYQTMSDNTDTSGFSEYHLVTLNDDGDLISDLDVSRYFENQIFLYGVYDTEGFFYVYSQPMIGSEDISEQGSHFILEIDCKTGEAQKTEIDCEPSMMIALYSGDIAAMVYDTWTGKNTIKLWDKEEKIFSEEEVDFSDSTFHEIYPAYEDKFYYIDSSKGILSLYDLSEQRTEQVIKLMDWNIPVLSAVLVSYVDSSHMIIVGDGAVYRLTKMKVSEMEKKTEILLGCLGSYNESDLVAEFNRTHPEYQIVIKNYIPDDEDSEDIDYDEAVSMLTKDILTGNAPDLIDLSGIDYTRYSGSGMFEDLYPYIRQDEEFKNRNLNQNILNLFEEDGALYALPSRYVIDALASEKQILGDELFTLDKYLEIASTYADDPDKKLFHRISREKLLSTLFAYNEDYLIDYKSKTCNFTDGVFEKLLNIAKEHPSYQNEDEAYMSETAKLENLTNSGQILFYPMDLSDIITEYQFSEKIFDNQFYITGYPSVEGNKVAVTVDGNLYAISTMSQHKDICWEFVKQAFDSFDERSEFQRSYQFPVDNDALEVYFEELESASIGYFENGEAMPIDIINGINIYAPTKEEISKIRELVNRVNTLIPDRYAGDIYKILEEEAKSFYAGDKTAKEVSEVIQSRVNILINEN